MISWQYPLLQNKRAANQLHSNMRPSTKKSQRASLFISQTSRCLDDFRSGLVRLRWNRKCFFEGLKTVSRLGSTSTCYFGCSTGGGCTASWSDHSKKSCEHNTNGEDCGSHSPTISCCTLRKAKLLVQKSCDSTSGQLGDGMPCSCIYFSMIIIDFGRRPLMDLPY